MDVMDSHIDCKKITRDKRAAVAKETRDKLRAAGISGVKVSIAKSGDKFSLRLYGSLTDLKLAEIVVFSKPQR